MLYVNYFVYVYIIKQQNIYTMSTTKQQLRKEEQEIREELEQLNNTITNLWRVYAEAQGQADDVFKEIKVLKNREITLKGCLSGTLALIEL